jgi:outer membrane protein assembly factor BamD (BamD/ComL family)
MPINSKDIEKHIEEGVRWIREHQERFWAITGTLLISSLFIALLIHRKETETDDAWSQLGGIQSHVAQGKWDDAQKEMADWETRFRSSSASAYAKFMKADMAYHAANYPLAAQIYGEIAQNGQPQPVRPLALFGQISCEEMAGRLSESQKLAQSFLDTYPDHYLAAPVYMTQARLAELTNNSAAAVAIYDRFTLLFPQSPWTALAKSRSQALSKK